MVGVNFFYYNGSENRSFCIDKIEEDEYLGINEVVQEFREFLESVFGYTIDEKDIVKYWERM